MFQKPLEGRQAKKDEVDCGEREEKTSFCEIDNVCHPAERVEYLMQKQEQTDCLSC